MASLQFAGLSALTAAGAIAGALVATPALAQAGAAEAVERCRTLATDSERILCLEQALLAEPPEASVAPQAPVATPPAPAASEFDRPGVRLPGMGLLSRRSNSADPVISSDSPDAEAFGAETVTARQRRAGEGPEEVVPRLVASVVDVQIFPVQRLQVELDNGQIWRQIQSDEPSWNAARDREPDQVEIWPTRLGGYRMLIPGRNRTLRVERVQ